MRIGIIPNLDRSAGGVYQYAVTMLEALSDIGSGDEFVVFTYGGESLPDELAKTWTGVPLRRGAGLLGKVGALGARLTGGAGRVDAAWRRFFERHGVDLLVFTADSDLAFISGVPYMVAIHDIQHRLHPEFPEVSANGEWEAREARIRPLIQNATVILVDSEVGKEDVLEQYGDTGIASEAVRPLPFLPAHYLEAEVSAEGRAAMRARYGLDGRYLFYPAQFWPHKNHKRLVEALAKVAECGHRIPLVLVGSAEGDLRSAWYGEIMGTAQALGVSDLVKHLGYVPDEMMSALYAEAFALVMPTFFGPTNIPALEAFQLSCPVITSDIRGIREHMGDAAILVDPESVDSIAAGIERLLDEPGLRESLVDRGHQWLRSYTRDDYLRLLREALAEAKHRVEAST